MSVGFGFSVGDFIAALNIISEVVDALRESGDSSKQCRQLLRQLYDLETALIMVKRIELDEAQTDQLHALRRSAVQCRITVDEFMTKIEKYQPHLHDKGLSIGFDIKRSWYKVKWALCRKDDVETFKADIAGHTEAINILMNAIQLQKMTIESREHDKRHFSLKGMVQDCYNNAMIKLSAISDAVTTSVTASKQLLRVTARTALIDCKTFAIVIDIRDMLRNTIAPQILRSQPVHFVDVFGTHALFHLDFVQSSEALLAVLRCNMKGNDLALRRIARGDFAFSDVATKNDIDLSRPWHMCFRPGQRVDMSMILNDLDTTTSVCPSCKFESPGEVDKDVECSNCGLTYRRLTEVSDSYGDGQDDPIENRDDSVHASTLPTLDNSHGLAQTKKRKREEDVTQELLMYRKIRLRPLPLFIPPLHPTSCSYTLREPMDMFITDTSDAGLPDTIPESWFTTYDEAHANYERNMPSDHIIDVPPIDWSQYKFAANEANAWSTNVRDPASNPPNSDKSGLEDIGESPFIQTDLLQKDPPPLLKSADPRKPARRRLNFHRSSKQPRIASNLSNGSSSLRDKVRDPPRRRTESSDSYVPPIAASVKVNAAEVIAAAGLGTAALAGLYEKNRKAREELSMARSR